MKVLRKIVGKTKIDRVRSNKSENHAASNLIMNGWQKGESETDM